LALGLVLMGAASALAATSARQRTEEVRALAARIDQIVEAELAVQKVPPAARADDAEFVRRVYLDLAGRIPLPSEARRFLDDRRPDRRQALVEELLASPYYYSHFTRVWREFLLSPASVPEVRFLGSRLEVWLRPRLQRNEPYDRLVRELLTQSIEGAGRPGRGMGGMQVDFNALAFYQANELKPENLAASTARLFLGIRLECAQCHNHPFTHWKREQFWEMAAFFSGVRQRNPLAGAFSDGQENAELHEIEIPGTNKTVQARLLNGKPIAWKDNKEPRRLLAEWVTARDNPYFARMAANRLWAHFLGMGLVDPVDDFNDANLPSHPQLLDELAAALADHGFDTTFLIRAITASRAYQRTSAVTEPSQNDSHLFARMALKGLTAEQLYDSLAAATGFEEPPPGPIYNPLGQSRDRFLAQFAHPADRRTEQTTSILQALALMNGDIVGSATSLDRSATLAALVDAPFLDNRQRLEALFLAALARPPRPEEARRLLAYIERGGPTGSARKALADVFWVLLNSSEFHFNH
jgi:hypothetical protein